MIMAMLIVDDDEYDDWGNVDDDEERRIWVSLHAWVPLNEATIYKSCKRVYLYDDDDDEDDDGDNCAVLPFFKITVYNRWKK